MAATSAAHSHYGFAAKGVLTAPLSTPVEPDYASPEARALRDQARVLCAQTPCAYAHPHSVHWPIAGSHTVLRRCYACSTWTTRSAYAPKTALAVCRRCRDADGDIRPKTPPQPTFADQDGALAHALTHFAVHPTVNVRTGADYGLAVSYALVPDDEDTPADVRVPDRRDQDGDDYDYAGLFHDYAGTRSAARHLPPASTRMDAASRRGHHDWLADEHARALTRAEQRIRGVAPPAKRAVEALPPIHGCDIPGHLRVVA